LAERRVGYVPRKLSEEELLSMTDEELARMRAQRERARLYYAQNRDKLLNRAKARYHDLKDI
jgi:ABC-type Mn2+/Zn2+ transport system ATPase subunit